MTVYNRPAGPDAAREQVAVETAMESFFNNNRNDVDHAFTDEMEIFKRCIKNGQIQLETELVVYDSCPPDGKLFDDFVVP